MRSLPIVGLAWRVGRTIALTALGLAAAPVAAAQSFAAPLQALPATAQDVVTLDLDAVGAPDLAVLCGNDVSLRRALPGGGYEENELFATGGFGGRLAVADMDLDGDDDLVLSRYGHLQVYLLQGGYGLLDWNYPSGGYALDLGDLDGDGDTDIVVADFNLDQITVRLGLGFSGLGPPVTYPTGSHPFDIALGDLDGDGVLDVVTSDTTGLSITARLGNGAGAFGPALTHALTEAPHRLVLTETNGDGQLDAVVGTDSGLHVLHGDGTGGFTTGPTLPLSDPFEIEAHDVDGDGAEDLVATFGLPAGLAVWLADGQGGFEQLAPSFAGADLRALVVEDLDLDGRADIAAATDDTFLMTARGDGAGGFDEPLSTPLQPTLNRFTLADLDGDGHEDLLGTQPVTGTVTARLADGAGGFGQPIASDVIGGAVATADFDGDGILDVATGSFFGFTVSLGDGAGGFVTAGTNPFNDYYMDSAAADMTGDGAPDVVLISSLAFFNFEWHTLEILPGDGTGQLGTAISAIQYGTYSTFPEQTSSDSLLLGDLDGDGDLDVALAEGTESAIRRFTNDGTGLLTSMGSVFVSGLGGSQQESLELVDIDGDGDRDLVARTTAGVSVLHGLGGGSFGAPLSIASLDYGRNVHAGDIDGDGEVDLLTDDSSTSFAVLWGDGTGEFEVEYYGAGAGIREPRLAQENGDGLPDVVALAPWAAPSSAAIVSLNLAASAQWADLGYGLAGTNGVPQLVGTGTLQAGSPGTLKLSHANPNKLAVLFISKQSNPAPFKGGVLATVPPLISFMLVTNPSGAINLSWPHWPGGAIGSHWYFQYGVVDSGGPAGAALSNAVRATQP